MIHKLLFAASVLLLISCRSGSLDEDGLSGTDTAQEQFTRASQLYYRGRLTASLEEFNGVVYRYPDSPLAQDARLAVRRIECDLSGIDPGEEGSTGVPAFVSRIAVVGRPAVTGGMTRTADLLRASGATVTEVTDSQAPEMTMVFHCSGYENEASVVADSLDRWLLRPESVAYRPGEELIEAVASGSDVLVIIGDDAVFESYLD